MTKWFSSGNLTLGQGVVLPQLHLPPGEEVDLLWWWELGGGLQHRQQTIATSGILTSQFLPWQSIAALCCVLLSVQPNPATRPDATTEGRQMWRMNQTNFFTSEHCYLKCSPALWCILINPWEWGRVWLDKTLNLPHGQVPESSRVFYDPRKSSRVFYDLRKSSRVFYSSKMCCQVIQAMFQLNQCSKGGPCSTNNVVNPWGPGGRRKSGDTLVILFQPFTAGQNIYHCAVHLYTHLFVYVTIDLTD